MVHNQLIRDYFGRRYKLHLPGDGPAPKQISPKSFHDEIVTRRFFQDIQVSDGYWRQLSYRLAGNLPYTANPLDYLDVIVRLAIQGRIQLFEIDGLDTSRHSIEKRIFKQRDGETFQFVQPSEKLIAPQRETKKFVSQKDAFAFVHTLGIEDKNLRSIVNAFKLPTPQSDEREKLLASISDALFEGKILAFVEGSNKPPSSPNAEYEDVNVKKPTLGPEPPTKLLELQKVDPHFAPSKEQLDITYRIKGLVDEDVTLEIHSKLHNPNILYLIELKADEKSDGTHTLSWDGKTNCSSGDLHDNFIHPLFGPYDVKLHGGGFSGKKPFSVLYHSVALEQDEWTADGKIPADQKAHAQLRLNELGYFGGPVGHDFDDYLKKAVIRYKANHKNFHKLNYSAYNDTIDASLLTALDAGDNRRDWLTGNALNDPSGESKLYVEAITYEDGEFGNSKSAKEKDRLNRPALPIAAKVYLKDKSGNKILAPDAVGPVRINWLVEDPDEDLSLLRTSTPAEPSLTKKYVEKTLKTKSGRAGDGDNCHEDYAGIRTSAATNWESSAILGAKLEGYDVKKDGGQKCIYSEACTDKNLYPKRFGKAGFLFRPSYVGGDDFKIKAEMDFTGLPNKVSLENLHGVVDRDHRLHVKSGVIRIWRKAKVAMLINWPARSVANPWAGIAKEFEEAYVELDTSTLQTKKISEVITEHEYKTIVTNNTAHLAADVSLLDDSFCGVNLPNQGTMNAGAYKSALRSFTAGNYWDLIYSDLREKISEKVRKDYPTGFILVDFLGHLPVNIQAAPPANTTIVEPNFITWISSIGLTDSVVLADQKDPDKVYYVVAHEFGHNFWLKHWEHAGGSQATNHDTDDHNCIMSYSSQSCAHAHHLPGTYTPHFCGKCNLKLRGWNIDAPGIPADSA